MPIDGAECVDIQFFPHDGTKLVLLLIITCLWVIIFNKKIIIADELEHADWKDMLLYLNQYFDYYQW